MAEEKSDIFCTQCGQRISEDTEFCPSCGASVSEMNGAPAASGAPVYNNMERANHESRLKIAAVFIVIGAVLSLISGIYLLASAQATLDALVASEGWANFVKAFTDSGMTEQDAKNLILNTLNGIGVYYIIVGAMLGVAAYCSIAKKLFVLGFVLCIIATVLSLPSILGLIIGIIVCVMYYKSKPVFTS